MSAHNIQAYRGLGTGERKSKWFLIVAVCCPLLTVPWSGAQAAATPPALFFSDLTSGPNTGGENNNGAYVTLYGNNFGANPTVIVGGGSALIKLQPSSYLWYQKMTIQLGPNAATGNIVVTNSNGSSNGLPFTVRAGTIYFVSPSGKDSNLGTFSQPWASPATGKDTMAPGDIVYLRGGTYSALDPLDPNGQSVIWISMVDASGAPGRPKALVGYPGEKATIDASCAGCNNGFKVNYGTAKDWTLAEIAWRSAGTTLVYWHGSDADRLRLVGNSFNGAYDHCFLVNGPLTNNAIYGNDFNNCATDPLHKSYAIYYGGYGVQDGIDLGWNNVHYDGPKPMDAKGFQFYGHVDGDYIRNVKIHDNVFYDLCMDAIVMGATDATANDVFENTNTQYLWNNIFVHNGTCSPNYGYPAVQFGSHMGNNGIFKLYNNTFYANGGSPMPSPSGDVVNEDVHLIELDNNIFYAPTNPPGTYCGYACVNYGAPVSEFSGSNNLWFNFGNGPSWALNSINGTDPKLLNPTINPANFDFHLQANSPAIGAGMNTSAIVTQDHDGIPRPQASNGQFAIGAYEFNAGAPPPPPPTTSPCDVNGDGTTNVADVQLEINMALGISPCTNPSGTCTVVSVQRVVNAALGGSCVAP